MQLVGHPGRQHRDEHRHGRLDLYADHFAISITREEWEAAKARLEAAGVELHLESGTSMYFRDPDGARLELIADPLGEMYGNKVS